MNLWRKSNGQRLVLDTARPLGSPGGEGTVYPVRSISNLAAKVFHLDKRTTSRRDKILAMLAQPPSDPGQNSHPYIAWPLEILLDQGRGGNFVGFLMPRVNDVYPIERLYNTSDRWRTCPGFHYRYLIMTGRNIAAAFAALHRSGYVVGDVNESNILVSANALPTLIDNDSIQVPAANGRVHFCEVATGLFTPPEMVGANLKTHVRQEEQDRFGLAVLLFQLLMEGFHPYSGGDQKRGPGSIEESLQGGLFCFGGSSSALAPPRGAPPFTMLPDSVQELFRRSFERSQGHQKPSERPRAGEWQKTLDQFAESLQTCASNPQHQYANHLTNCPWCERTQLLGGLDPFPSAQAVQQGLHLRPMAPTRRKPAQPAAVTAAPPAPGPAITSQFAPALSRHGWAGASIAFTLASWLPSLSLLASLAGACSLFAKRRAPALGGSTGILANCAVAASLAAMVLHTYPRLREMGTLGMGGSQPESSATNAAQVRPVAVDSGGQSFPASSPPAVTNTPAPIAATQRPQTGQRYTIPNLGMKLSWIQPGSFTMGSPVGEVGRFDNEGPPRQVTISQGFWLGQFEVTQGQWQTQMGSNPSSFKGSTNLPVENVSYVDAANFCAKLTEQERQAGRIPTDWVYRLPTEAEWEYACRAGMTTPFSFGDDPQYSGLANYAWYDGNSGNRTHPVGEKQPNPWGLHDLHGNVWEWCLDWSGAYPGGSVTDPKGPPVGSFRVIRGGSWYGDGRFCRSALRNSHTPDFRANNFGFRVVLASGQP